ncbi:MAG: TIGR04086 family membrane protein [Acidimicrobiia bacterium]|nr:TIGR04086 family membrane protein [Acidimicrobiia bacterium]
MTDVLPSGPSGPRGQEEPALPVSGIAVMAGVLAAYGAFAVLISIVAAFANGAHSHQVLSGATWKQLGTGGGIVAGIVLFLAWAAGGFIAARMAGHDGIRHGIWVFVVGVVFITVVGAAITWLPDTTAILRNLRLLGLPVRRNEWRDIGTVAGLASLIGSAAGAVVGGWFAFREKAPAAERVRPPAPAVPVAAPPPVAEPVPAPSEAEAEAAFARPSLFEETGFEPEPLAGEEPDTAPAPVAATPESAIEQKPAWLQFIQERERSIQERDQGSALDETYTPAPPAPAPWASDEPAPAFLDEPEPEAEPTQPTSWWPERDERPEEPVRTVDDAWALPDDEDTPGGGGEADRAFPPSPPTPVPAPEPDDVEVPPLGEHADWKDDDELYRAPPEPVDDDVLQHAPEAPPPEVGSEEREARRRQQEEAARAYEQMRDDQ